MSAQNHTKPGLQPRRHERFVNAFPKLTCDLETYRKSTVISKSHSKLQVWGRTWLKNRDLKKKSFHLFCQQGMTMSFSSILPKKTWQWALAKSWPKWQNWSAVHAFGRKHWLFKTTKQRFCRVVGGETMSTLLHFWPLVLVVSIWSYCGTVIDFAQLLSCFTTSQSCSTPRFARIQGFRQGA